MYQHAGANGNMLDVFQAERLDYPRSRPDALEKAAVVKLRFEQPVPMQKCLGLFDQWLPGKADYFRTEAHFDIGRFDRFFPRRNRTIAQPTTNKALVRGSGMGNVGPPPVQVIIHAQSEKPPGLGREVMVISSSPDHP